MLKAFTDHEGSNGDKVAFMGANITPRWTYPFAFTHSPAAPKGAPVSMHATGLTIQSSQKPQIYRCETASKNKTTSTQAFTSLESECLLSLYS